MTQAADAGQDGSLWPAAFPTRHIDAVLFDLGNTLVSYYRAADFPPILERCISEALEVLRAKGWCFVPEDTLARARALNRERPDLRVWPLRERLSHIFEQGSQRLPDELLEALCARFLEPIFATGRLDPDAIPCLKRLRAAGFKVAIVSNTPWGSPGAAWREELSRRGLLDLVDQATFCADVGWRKPAPQIFQRALDGLGVQPSRALFVGDDLHWDVQGASAAGMVPVLLSPTRQAARCLSIRSLAQLLALLA